MNKQNKKNKWDFVDTFQCISVFGLAFFIAMTGTYVIGQLDGKIPEWLNVLFALSVVLSAQYVIFNHIDKLDVIRDEEQK